MQQTITPAQAIVVGRDAELALLGRFVSGRDAPVAFVLAGGPGLGKTTLWEAGLQMARQNGLRVLAARPTDAEAGPSFAALADLLEELDTATLSRVPHPQKRALEIALLRAEPTGTPTEQRVAALAAEGLSNKEIPATLFVTVHTVEVHLSHAYSKLGIRSRAQLARRLPAAEARSQTTSERGTSWS